MRWYWVMVATLCVGCSDDAVGGAGSSGEEGSDSAGAQSDGEAEDADTAPSSDGLPDSGGSSSDTGDDESTTDPTAGSEESTGSVDGPEEGSIRVLTYNVAGLPDLISGSDPAVNTPLISPLLDAFELVLVQEDFSYHAQLAADANHPHQSEPGGGGTLGDGLNRFSQSAFTGFERYAWLQCNGIVDSGNDCLTAKGFSVSTHEFGPGALVDIYNLHMDAGGSSGDIEARQAQIQQILETIETRSTDRAVIVAGDTNMDEEDEADFQTLLIGADLIDSCRELDCGDEYRIDRIMFRNSAAVELTPSNWLVDESFVDGNGDPLSDHEAVAVDLDWKKL